MKRKTLTFMEVMKSNSEEDMREYLLHAGKKPKPISPFIFDKKSKAKNSLQDKSPE